MFEGESKMEYREKETRKIIIDHIKNAGLPFLNIHLKPYREQAESFVANLTPEDIKIFEKYMTLVCYLDHLSMSYEVKKLKKELPELEKQINTIEESITKHINKVGDDITQIINQRAIELDKKYRNRKNPEFIEKKTNLYLEAKRLQEKNKLNPLYCRREFYAYLKNKIEPYVVMIKNLQGSPISEK